MHSFITLFSILLPLALAADQVALTGSCNPGSAGPSSEVTDRLGNGSGGSTKAALLAFGDLTLSCSKTNQWTIKSDTGYVFDMSCLARSNPAAFDTLPSRALPIYTRYKTSSGAIRSKLGSLVGFSPVQAGTLSLSGSTYTVDLRKGFGSSARLRSSTKNVVRSTPNRNARAWERFQPSANSFGDTVFLSFAAGGAPPSKCKKGKTTTLPYAAQIWVLDASSPASTIASEPSPTSGPDVNSVISASGLQPFCSQYNAVETTRVVKVAKSTITHYTSTTTVTLNPAQQTVTSTSYLTRYTASSPTPAPSVPAALQSFQPSAIESGCSRAAPHPVTYTSYKTSYSGVATRLADHTQSVSLEVPTQAVATQIVFQTVTAPEIPGVVQMGGDSSLEDRNDNSSTGWGSFGFGYPLLSSQLVQVYGSGGATAASYLQNHRNEYSKLMAAIKDGDTVVLEFGINDSRQDPRKIGVNYFKTPMKTMVANLRAKAKDLIIVISSPIPLPTVNGSFRDGKFYLKYFSGSSEYDWPGLAREVAAELGVYFVDHANAVADAYERLGKDYVIGMYEDGIHTDGKGAYIVAEAFIKAAKCSNAASGVFQFDEAGQQLEPFCSKYGVSKTRRNVALQSSIRLVQTTLEAPFCFAIPQCSSPDHECLPICKDEQLVD